MGAVATFDPAAFKVRYPEFTTVSSDALSAYFTEATLYLANDGTGPVQDAGQQLLLLNMIVAHLAQMNATVNGQAPSSIVGRIGSASEGSVSVSTDMGGVPGSAAWFAQTRYGFSWWQATARYRSFLYVPQAAPPVGPFPIFGGNPQW